MFKSPSSGRGNLPLGLQQNGVRCVLVRFLCCTSMALKHSHCTVQRTVRSVTQQGQDSHPVCVTHSAVTHSLADTQGLWCAAIWNVDEVKSIRRIHPTNDIWSPTSLQLGNQSTKSGTVHKLPSSCRTTDSFQLEYFQQPAFLETILSEKDDRQLPAKPRMEVSIAVDSAQRLLDLCYGVEEAILSLALRGVSVQYGSETHYQYTAYDRVVIPLHQVLAGEFDYLILQQNSFSVTPVDPSGEKLTSFTLRPDSCLISTTQQI